MYLGLAREWGDAPARLEPVQAVEVIRNADLAHMSTACEFVATHEL